MTGVSLLIWNDQLFQNHSILISAMEKAAAELETKFEDAERRLDKVRELSWI